MFFSTDKLVSLARFAGEKMNFALLISFVLFLNSLGNEIPEWNFD